jgi:hypothetical protein
MIGDNGLDANGNWLGASANQGTGDTGTS